MLANPNNLEDPANEVLFPMNGHGLVACNPFEVKTVDAVNTAIPVRFNPVVLSEIKLPNNQTYQFKYNRYGEISKIINPTGSHETFEYTLVPPMNGFDSPAYDQTNRGVKEHKVFSSDGTLIQRWQYKAEFATGANSFYKVTTTAPKGDDPSGEGAKSERYLIADTKEIHSFGFERPEAGMPKEELSYSEPDAATGERQLMSRKLMAYETWTLPGQNLNGLQVGQRDARADKEIEIIFDPNNTDALARMSDYGYDGAASSDYKQFANLNVKEVKRYDYLAISRGDGETKDIAYLANLFASQGKLLTTENIEYKYDDPDYTDKGIVGLVKRKEIKDGGNRLVAQSETFYDEGGTYTPQPYAAAACWIDQTAATACWKDPGLKRGKATTSKIWDRITNAWFTTHVQFDQFGNPVKAWDAKGNFTETEYDANPSGTVPASLSAANFAYVYPKKSYTPVPSDGVHGTTERFSAETAFDLTTGLPLTVKDANGQITQTKYTDPVTGETDKLLRPRQATAPNGHQTITEYGDAPGNLFVKTKTQIDDTNWAESTAFLDSLGRAYQTKTKDAAGDVFALSCFDNLGRVKKASNPFRGAVPANPCTTPNSLEWSETVYDLAGRPTIAIAPDGARSETRYGIVAWGSAVGTTVTAKDPAGKMTRNVTDSQGRLVRVDEPSNAQVTPPPPSPTPTPTPVPSPTPPIGCLSPGDPCFTPAPGWGETETLGAATAPKMATVYRYDPLGNMVKVEQGGQSRFFLHDSLGRLLRVRQPEQDVNSSLTFNDAVNFAITGNDQWTAAFNYDANGNVLTATDAKGVTITNSYDNLNRVKTRVYGNVDPNHSDAKKKTAATSNASYKYDGLLTGGIAGDQNPPVVPVEFARGKLTEVRNDESINQMIDFDLMGRVEASRQITRTGTEPVTSGQIYKSSYKYTLSGALEEQTYPQGRVVKNAFNSDGDLSSIKSRKNTSSGEATYASGFAYTASGAISDLRLGNGLYEAARFNSRLQITNLILSPSPVPAAPSSTGAELMYLYYGYGGANNNGNISEQWSVVPTQGSAIGFYSKQTFSYDSLNRLTNATEQVQPFGNPANCDLGAFNCQQTWQQTFDYDRYGNRKQFTQNIDGQNLADNPINFPRASEANNRLNEAQGYNYDYNGNVIQDAEQRSFSFNPDNKQVAVSDASSGAIIGQYFYDADGKRVKKFVPSTNETTVFVYDAMGKLVAEYSTTPPPANPQTSYTATDLLGSPRVITNQSGQVTARRDFMPFGEELSNGAAYRSADQKFTNADSVRQRFTGYQRDEETGLDFAEARYYQNRHGRFTAVDPLLASGKSENPQTFNRYTYTSNNPIVRVDENGLDWFYSSSRRGGVTRSRPYYSSKAPAGARRWTATGRSYVYYAAKEEKWVTLNPWENDFSRHDTKEGAVAAFNGYRNDALNNGLVGAADAISLTFQIARRLGGVQVNESSEMYMAGNTVGTAYSIALAVTGGGAAILNSGAGILSRPLRFSQNTASFGFQDAGYYAGKTIEDIASALRNGDLKPNEIPVEFVQGKGVNLIVNTRSSLALMRANIPIEQWRLVDVTSDAEVMTRIRQRLTDNNLTRSGTDVIQIGKLEDRSRIR